MRKFINIINEAAGYLAEYRVEAHGIGGETHIFSGPTAQQMADLAAREDYRGVAYANKVYLGRAYEWTHNAMATILGLPDDEWEPFFVSTLDRAMADDRGDEWLEGVFDPDQLSIRHPLGFVVINAIPGNTQFARMVKGAQRIDEVAAPTSQSFRAWFRDSKVVDQHGNPEILFHGTRKQFSGLRANNARHHINHKLLFASSSPEAASEFAGVDRDEEPEGDDQWTGGNVHPIYMRMEKPFCYTDLEEMGDYERPLSDQISREVLELLGQGRYNNLVNYGDWAILEDDKVLAWLKSKGYDGFTAWEAGGLSYACFDESQVASIFAFRD